MSDELLVLDPHGTMSLTVQQTHYMPKKWRGKENTEFVRVEFETLFQVHSFAKMAISIHFLINKLIWAMFYL